MRKMQYRFFKGDLSQEPLKTIYADWQASAQARQDKINQILDEYPFYDGLFTGSAWYIRTARGISCKVSSKDEVLNTKGYKLTRYDETHYIVKPDKRYKIGRKLAEDLEKINKIYEEHRDLSYFILDRLGMVYIVHDWWDSPTSGRSYLACVGVCNAHLLIKMPTPLNETENKKFPEVPDYLTEIKESEFLMLQGK